ncbi:ribonuclease III [Phormidium tenue]|uniref:Ribonuclease 3 n=1 Tax=Phormidium tenue NIES-30 TaxID=549789 RepID=A0A1U7J6V9_9CYAN|nr:ribonuclease III [Phormidium tenue]MBD2233581.1 ribonuclease III [Phormidium tenue FACHB-1052]OKH48682.1 ribonuclease III [Phormidium tenue NIES-30]
MLLPSFQNPALLRQALTHSSYANEHPNEGPDYDRLEFLGDGILELVVRDLIFARYPHLAVGEMSQRCDRLVDEPSLAELAVQLGIPDQMRLGAGAQHERHNPSVQADMFEAVIGAYRLDAGIAAAYSYVEAIMSPLIDRALDLQATDPVTELQEYVQAHMGGTLPSYLEKERLGPDHAKVFTLEVWAGGTNYGIGQGRSIKEARKNAAIAALRILKP